MARTGPVTKDVSAVALGLAQIRVGKSAANISQIAPVLVSDDSIGALANTKYLGEVSYWKLESGFPLLEDITIALRESASLECSFKELSAKNLALARGIDPFADVAAAVTEIANNSLVGSVSGAITVDNAGGVVTDVFTVVIEGEAAGTTTYSVYGQISGQVIASLDDDSIQAPDNAGNPYFSIPSGFFNGAWVADETYTFRTTEFVLGTAAYADNHSGTIGLGSVSAPEFVRLEAVYTYPNQTNHMYVIFPRANVVSSVELDMQAEDAVNVPITFEAKRADSEIVGGNVVWDAMPLGLIQFD